ncbi:MAG: glucose-1-phosphate adenylyltransferase [Planctomycetota bacterium]|nr:glucose-1-phosphate adenylyltransferase [Planctomycetota bacterium]MEC8336784.1 glucose-1-phosphate adenylyltransferase [Planctomycetota bacterium]
MNDVATLILGGGRGTRLYPLTRYRSKPAVPLAGKYRLIDIPISNCINSGLRRIYVLTQFMSVSLHRHIRNAYIFDRFSDGFVEILAAQQTVQHSEWYQGTADAVRRNIGCIKHRDIKHVLILSGDQLYRMNFSEMLKTHLKSGAEATIAARPVTREEASGFGIMQLDDSGRVKGFVEKPQSIEQMEQVRMDPSWIDSHGVESQGRDLLASMGIYLFDRDFLVEVLENNDFQDFGKEVFPASIRKKHVNVHLFDGYWEDIGTIGSFYRCSLELASAQPPFNFMMPEAPIYSHARYLPPSRIDQAQVHNSVVADGCILEKGVVIENSAIGLRCRIGPGAQIRNSVLMGADYYDTSADVQTHQAAGTPLLGIGSNAVIDGAIIDKNCRIGRGARISNPNGQTNSDLSDDVFVRDGVVVVQKDSVIPPHWEM